MERLVLEAETRDSKQSPKHIRAAKMIPAVFYGKGEQSASLQVGYQAFRRLFKTNGFTGVFDLEVSGAKKPVLVHDVQYDPLSDNFVHVDFMMVNLKQKVTAQVPVEIVGEAPAVKNFSAILTIAKHEVEVKCLPMDIPHSIQIDATKLENINDAVRIADLNLGDNVEVHAEPEDVVVIASAPRVEEVERNVEVPDDVKADPVAAAEGEGEKKEEDKGE